MTTGATCPSCGGRGSHLAGCALASPSAKPPAAIPTATLGSAWNPLHMVLHEQTDPGQDQRGIILDWLASLSAGQVEAVMLRDGIVQQSPGGQALTAMHVLASEGP